MRKFLSSILVVSIAILSGLIFLAIKKDTNDSASKTAGDQQTTFSGGVVPVAAPTDFDNGVIQISTRSGSLRQINGQFNSQDITELGDDIDILFESYETDETEMFDIYYDEVNGSLLVTLDREPLDTARALAARKLEGKLGLSASELCDLNISVITNSYVSSVYAGYELGMPNCPGAISLTPGSN